MIVLLNFGLQWAPELFLIDIELMVVVCMVVQKLEIELSGFNPYLFQK